MPSRAERARAGSGAAAAPHGRRAMAAARPPARRGLALSALSNGQHPRTMRPARGRSLRHPRCAMPPAGCATTARSHPPMTMHAHCSRSAGSLRRARVPTTARQRCADVPRWPVLRARIRDGPFVASRVLDRRFGLAAGSPLRRRHDADAWASGLSRARSGRGEDGALGGRPRSRGASGSCGCILRAHRRTSDGAAMEGARRAALCGRVAYGEPSWALIGMRGLPTSWPVGDPG